MLKVFMKIPGVPRPHAVVGTFLFEDERFLVLAQDVIRRKVLWEKVLYVEELPTAKDLELDDRKGQENGPADVNAKGVLSTQTHRPTTSITVAFTGATNKLFTIDGVDAASIAESKWTPDLARTIFANAQIKPILGSFVVKDINVDGANVTIVTDQIKKDDVIADMHAKMDLVTKFADAATKVGAPRKGRPTMKLPTDFSMSMSPFDKPVALGNYIDNSEILDDSDRKEKGSGEE